MKTVNFDEFNGEVQHRLELSGPKPEAVPKTNPADSEGSPGH